MSGFRGEYTTFEWLQIAACFLGAPLAALVGAWLAQARAVKTGRVFGPMLLGLGVAAGLAVLQFCGFLLLVSMAGGSSSIKVLPLFDSYLGAAFVCVTVVAALVTSFVIGIRQNASGAASPESQASFTLRQFLMLQLFCFMVLGCWTSMRLLALNSLSPLERAQRKWTQRDWKFRADPQKNFVSLEYLKEYSEVDYAAENAHLRDAAREEGLTSISLGAFLDPQRLELAALSDAKKLQYLRIYYAYDSQLSTAHLNDLTRIASLEQLVMKSAGSIAADLSPLAKLPNLRNLEIRTVTIAPADLNGLKQSRSIRSLSLEDYTATELEPILFPESLTELSLQSRFFCTLSAENFRSLKNLRKVTVNAMGMTRQEISVIAAAPQLEEIFLGGIADLADLELLAQSPHLKRICFKYLPQKVQQDEACAVLLQKLAMLPKLIVIECDPKFLLLWGDGDEDLVQLVTRNADGSIQYGKSGPRLLVERRMPKFQAMIDDLRAKANLGKLEIRFFPYETIVTPITPRQYFKKTSAPGAKL